MRATPIVRVLHHPKSSHAEDEWEDAAAYSERRGVAAVADGAAASYRAARWANALVESFITTDVRLDPAGFEQWVAKMGEEFQDQSIDASGGASWYASDASRRGAFATFCGIRFHEDGPAYSAGHVGDACLFHTRGDDLVSANLTDPGAFDTMPDLVSSAEYGGSHGTDKARFLTGGSPWRRPVPHHRCDRGGDAAIGCHPSGSVAVLRGNRPAGLHSVGRGAQGGIGDGRR